MAKLTLEAVNERLKAALMPVRVKARNDRLFLRATLPPKAGSHRDAPYQQEIACHAPANSDGLVQARNKALALGADLIAGRFDWDDWGGDRVRRRKTCGDIIKRFEEEYRTTHELADRTWRENWAKVFAHLPPAANLTAALILELAQSKPPNTRIRQQYCEKLQHLADFANIDCDVLRYKGNYGRSKVKERQIPDDVLIEQVRAGIKSPQWQLVYSLMAAYGLRPHEVFFCSFIDGVLHVTQGKTGPRVVYQAFRPEWADQWGILRARLPWTLDPSAHDLPNVDAIASYEKGNLGRKVNTALRRAGLPFQPYCLRHAYALRGTVANGIPERIMAQLMGHTVDEHLKTYNRWLSVSRGQEIVKDLLSR